MSFLIGDYEIDVELSASPYYASQVTRHPVERGSDISDHVRVEPDRLSLEGIVSNSPHGELKDRREKLITVNGETFAKPAEEADAYFRSVQTAGEPVTVECSLGTFDNMILVGYSPRASTLDELYFTADFERITIVDNERVTITIRPKTRTYGHKATRQVRSIEAPDAKDAPPSAATKNAVARLPGRLK